MNNKLMPKKISVSMIPGKLLTTKEIYFKICTKMVKQLNVDKDFEAGYINGTLQE